MKTFITFIIAFFAMALKAIQTNTGEISLRALFLSKEEKRKELDKLWTVKETREWSKEEKEKYERVASEVTKLNSDIKLRSQYLEDFKQSKSKEDIDFARSEKDASLFKIIKSKIYEQTRDSAYKDDFGRVNEVLAEHRNKNKKHIKDGFTPIPESSFQKRTDVTSTQSGGDSLISEVVRPDQFAEGLYESTWMSEVGVRILSGLEGDIKIPQIKDKPSFSWIAENANFPDQDLAFEDVTLSPKYAGAIQVFSLGIFLRSQGMSIVRFVQQELMRAFRSGLEKSFLQDDGSGQTPKGLSSLISAGNTVNASKQADGSAVDANTGGVPSYAEALEVESKIVTTNQSMPLKWIMNHKTRLKALQVLKFAVNGASQLYANGMFADRPAHITNSAKSDVVKGTETDLSEAYLIQPESLVLGRWLGGIQLQVNTQGAEYWKAGKTAVRVIDVCNLVSRRDSDFAKYGQLDV